MSSARLLGSYIPPEYLRGYKPPSSSPPKVVSFNPLVSYEDSEDSDSYSYTPLTTVQQQQPKSKSEQKNDQIAEQIWQDYKRNGMFVCAMCNRCGGSSSGTCSCAERQFKAALTPTEIQQFINKQTKPVQQSQPQSQPQPQAKSNNSEGDNNILQSLIDEWQIETPQTANKDALRFKRKKVQTPFTY